MIDFSNLPNAHRRAIEVVRDAAKEKNCRPYLVGGPVRDLLLGRSAFDLDITVEEDSSALARALAKQMNGRVKSFPQFLTYKVTADQMPEIDIATARKERYRSPGALPSVTAGHLRDDLLRRDFSINAIALDVIEGVLHDPTGGEADLHAGVVRVLHDQSFIDDPTRIYRGIRLAARLSFSIEPHTAQLMREAIATGALITISKERIWRELFLAMDEGSAPSILAAFVNHGALEVLFSKRTADVAALESVREQVGRNPELDRYVLYTSALLRGDASPVDLEGSGFSQKRARNIVQIANELNRFADSLLEAKTERQRLRVLKHASPEMLSVLSATQPAESGHVARFHEYQNFKLPLRGNDLEMPGGPHVSKALERTREAVFTGEIPAEEAREFARETALRYLKREEAKN
jgi:tRNA nucleotidyltransferase/poly(A) polymerase